MYPLSDNAFWLVGVQLLDGVGAGIFGALFPVIVDDLTKARAASMSARVPSPPRRASGAALSTSVAGLIVVKAGYGAAFVTLGAIAAAGFVVYFLAMPETKSGSKQALRAPRHQPQPA